MAKAYKWISAAEVKKFLTILLDGGTNEIINRCGLFRYSGVCHMVAFYSVEVPLLSAIPDFSKVADLTVSRIRHGAGDSR